MNIKLYMETQSSKIYKIWLEKEKFLKSKLLTLCFIVMTRKNKLKDFSKLLMM